MYKNKKTYLVATLVLVMCFALAGCFNSANQPTEVPDETLSPTGMPVVTTAPVVTTEPAVVVTPAPGTTATPMQSFDWRTQASMVEGRINMFSEIQECTIVICDQTALVGVKFTSSYKGELTQRIRDMIAGEVMAADSNITVVAVTSDDADYTAIQELAQRQKAGASDAEIKPDVDRIAKNATTMR